jgi:hypothetical protein
MPFHSDVADHTIHLRYEVFVLLWLLEQHNNYWVFIYDFAANFLFFQPASVCVHCVMTTTCAWVKWWSSALFWDKYFQFTNNPDNEILYLSSWNGWCNACTKPENCVSIILPGFLLTVRFMFVVQYYTMFSCLSSYKIVNIQPLPT